MQGSQKKNSYKAIASILFLLYAVILFKVMVLKDVPMLRVGPIALNFGGTQAGDPNYIPFKTIMPYLFGSAGWLIGGLNILGNILLLVPVGFLLPFIFQKMNWKHVLMISILSGLIIERMQVVLHVGIFDIDDVILNGLGVLVGCWIYLLFQKVMASSYQRIAIIILTTAIVSFIVAVLVFAIKNEIKFEDRPTNVRPDRVGPNRSELSSGTNPCGRTNGTGQVIEVAIDKIVIEKNDGKNEEVRFNQKTSFRDSNGEATASIVKVGDRVTIVTDDSNIAIAILVCGIKN
jgi:glycopeptide antibiotics resistance protein